MPVISIVITTKNRHDLLPRAIASALDQTYPDLEVIVVDDGSDIPVTLPVNDPRLRLFRNEQSVGLSAARNRGFREAQGEFFAMLDDDDFYLPDKLSKQLDFLQAHPNVDLVFSRVIVRDASGHDRHYLGQDHVHSPKINLQAFNVIHPASVLFRRALFGQIQFQPSLKKYEDTLFFNQVCFAYPTAYLPTDVAVWMQDGRKDQLTRLIATRNLANFAIVCRCLDDILNQHPTIGWRYYARLAFQALRCANIRILVFALMKTTLLRSRYP